MSFFETLQEIAVPFGLGFGAVMVGMFVLGVCGVRLDDIEFAWPVILGASLLGGGCAALGAAVVANETGTLDWVPLAILAAGYLVWLAAPIFLPRLLNRLDDRDENRRHLR
jgi:hypothetical protein